MLVQPCNIGTFVYDQGWAYVCIDKGMCGLNQVGIIANEALVQHMAPFVYLPV